MKYPGGAVLVEIGLCGELVIGLSIVIVNRWLGQNDLQDSLACDLSISEAQQSNQHSTQSKRDHPLPEKLKL